MEGKEIQEWKTISLVEDKVNVNKTSMEQLIAMSTLRLFDVLNMCANASVVLIESQPMGVSRNLKTKVLSHIIQSKLIEMGIPVVFRSPKLKLRDMPEQGTYAQNKKFAIQQTLSLIAGTPWETFFKSNSKKDDLADCFLQAHVYL